MIPHAERLVQHALRETEILVTGRIEFRQGSRAPDAAGSLVLRVADQDFRRHVAQAAAAFQELELYDEGGGDNLAVQVL